MARDHKTSRRIVQALLLACSVAFVLPFIWLISTSLKPIEQTLTLPLSFVPRAHTARLWGSRMEVTLDFQVAQPGAVVRYLSGDAAGKLGFLGANQLGNGAGEWTLVHPVAAGSWHVTQRIDRRLGEGGADPVWDILPRDQVESRVKFRWENYPRALAALGGDA